MCKPFVCFPIKATLTTVVVEDIKLDPFNNPAWEGLRLPTYGLPTKEVAHPCCKLSDVIFMGSQASLVNLFSIIFGRFLVHRCTTCINFARASEQP